MIRFGPAGLGGVKEAVSNLQEYTKLGLKACEIAFTYGVYIKEGKEAEEIRDTAKKLGIELSIHAPYWINLNSKEKKKVEEIMSRDLVVIEQNASLYNAFELMTGNQIGRLPVVDSLDHKKMIGLITREDIGRVYNIEIQSRLEEMKLSGSIE